MENEIINALLGGGLIGLSATILLLFSGKVAGISGIVEGSFFEPPKAENVWKSIFLLGLLLGGFCISLVKPEFLVNTYKQELYLVALGGLLVGFGTRLGSGCTSGHGVCGMSRLSLRSIVATLLFMLSGFITVALLFHLLGHKGGL